MISLLTTLSLAAIIDVPADDPSIYHAIAAATDGDEIVISSNIALTTAVVINKAITIRSSPGVEIDGHAVPNSSAFYIQSQVVFDSLTLDMGTGTSQCIFSSGDNVELINITCKHASSPWAGSALYVGGGSVRYAGGSLEDIHDITAPIYIAEGSLIVEDITVTEQHGATAGAIYAGQGSNLLVRRSEFQRNEGSTGAIYCYLAQSCVIEDSVFTENITTSSAGGAFRCYGGCDVRDSMFDSNQSTQQSGGAISAIYADLAVDGSWFSNNTAHTNGGAISCHTDSSCRIYNSTFENNAANLGAGIYAIDSSTTVGRSSFCRNTAHSQGGAIYNKWGVLDVFGSQFSWNTAGSHGGAILANGKTQGSYAMVYDNTFVGNQGTKGAAIGFWKVSYYQSVHNIFTLQIGDRPVRVTTAPSSNYSDINLYYLNSHSPTPLGPLSITGVNPLLTQPSGLCHDLDLHPQDWIHGSNSNYDGVIGALEPVDEDHDGSYAAVDCDDHNSEEFPDAVWYLDTDGDGFGQDNDTIQQCTRPNQYVAIPGDCDDTDSGISPAAHEQCDQVDHDCDGQPTNGVPFTDYYPDIDDDGHGDPTADSISACEQPLHTSTTDDDCDDNDPHISPSQPEECNGIDDNCDYQIDEGFTFYDFYSDSDGDGHGDTAAAPVQSCVQPTHTARIADDCDDSRLSIHPGAAEQCNQLDDDCNGVIDDLPPQTWYLDEDRDGFGGAVSELSGCAPGPAYVLSTGDCDDTNPHTSPAAVERCDGVDNNCSGSIDDIPNLPTWYNDLDGDGHGAGTGVQACAPTPDQSPLADDCDDSDPTRSPSRSEWCGDQVDNNCDGEVNEDCAARPQGCGCSTNSTLPSVMELFTRRH